MRTRCHAGHVAGPGREMTHLNIPSVSRHSGCCRKLMAVTMTGGTVHCWLSMIHSKVTPNCWLGTQLDMERLLVETAWDNLHTSLG